MADVGAYYYLWYDEDQWKVYRYVHKPVLDLYSSSDPEAMSRHIEWSKQYGINFFVVSWAGKEGLDGKPEKSDQNLRKQLLPSVLSHDFKFAILYESATRLPPDPNDAIDLDKPGYASRLVADLRDAAKYFDHPSYLKIHVNGEVKPLLILYRARNFTGQIADTIGRVKSALSDVYLVGDEVYWGGIIRSRLKIGPPKLKDPERMKLYDGVTAYNMHTRDREILGSFEKKLESEYGDWLRALSSVGVDFIPSAIPGYDDTKVPDRKNPPLLRGPERFSSQLEIAMKHLSKRNIVLITSFNEWHEDTQIEPAKDYKPPAESFSYLKALERSITLR